MLMAGSAITIICAAILSRSTKVAWLVTGAVVVGIGNGINSSIVMMCLTDCTP